MKTLDQPPAGITMKPARMFAILAVCLAAMLLAHGCHNHEDTELLLNPGEPPPARGILLPELP